MTENKSLRIIFTATAAAFTCYAEALALPVIVLTAVMLIDYITGMISAWYRRELSSRQGMYGIIKKLCYLFAVASAAGVDYLIGAGFGLIGISFGMEMIFGVLVTIWLITNELISIIENLTEIGVPLPGFLMIIAQKLKVTAELSVKNDAGTEQEILNNRGYRNILREPEKTVTAEEEENEPEKTVTAAEAEKKPEENVTAAEEEKEPEKTVTAAEEEKEPEKTVTAAEDEKKPEGNVTAAEDEKKPEGNVTAAEEEKEPEGNGNTSESENDGNEPAEAEKEGKAKENDK